MYMYEHTSMYAHSHNTQVGPEDTLAALGQASAGPIFGGNPASYFSAPASALFGIFGGSPARLNGGSGSEAGGGAEAEGGGAEIGGVFSLKGRERILASDGVEVLLQTQSPLHVNGRHRPEVGCLYMYIIYIMYYNGRHRPEVACLYVYCIDTHTYTYIHTHTHTHKEGCVCVCV